MVRATAAGHSTYVPPEFDPDCHCWIGNYYMYDGFRLFLDAFVAPGAGWGCWVSSFTDSPPSPSDLGAGSIRLTATGSCGPPQDLLYRFDVQDPQTGAWSLISDYGGQYDPGALPTPGQTWWSPAAPRL